MISTVRNEDIDFVHLLASTACLVTIHMRSVYPSTCLLDDDFFLVHRQLKLITSLPVLFR